MCSMFHVFWIACLMLGSVSLKVVMNGILFDLGFFCLFVSAVRSYLCWMLRGSVLQVLLVFSSFSLSVFCN